ncbi:MAG TPA: rRNA biogenesis protein rrp5 [Desulfosporosinus sp.]|jgi:ribosomal protein L24|nr:rRNA biogenesis protein rrp5 [Desulfosporosinus sp.]
MSTLEITLNNAQDLIAALTRLAEALENKQSAIQVETVEVVQKEGSFIAPEQPQEIRPLPKKEKAVTLEQVRAVLTAKSQAGKKAGIQGLFKRYDANKLTAVDPARYADLLRDAEEL